MRAGSESIYLDKRYYIGYKIPLELTPSDVYNVNTFHILTSNQIPNQIPQRAMPTEPTPYRARASPRIPAAPAIPTARPPVAPVTPPVDVDVPAPFDVAVEDPDTVAPVIADVDADKVTDAREVVLTDGALSRRLKRKASTSEEWTALSLEMTFLTSVGRLVYQPGRIPALFD